MESQEYCSGSEDDCSSQAVDRYVKQHQDTRLSRRLAFYLRYAAAQSGLEVKEGGYVKLESLLKNAKGMSYFTEEDVIKETASTSHRGNRRFEIKDDNGIKWIRACYGRKLARNPCHDGCSVKRLLHSTVEFVAKHIDDYDFDEFPDVLLGEILEHLKQQKRLTSTAMRRLLVPSLQRLDLRNALVTESVLRLVQRRCPRLTHLDLRGAGYALTDHSFSSLLKSLPELEQLHIADATHLTDLSVRLIPKRLPKLKSLNMSHIKSISERVILQLASDLPELHALDIFSNPNVSSETRAVLFEIATSKNMDIALRDISSKDDPEN